MYLTNTWEKPVDFVLGPVNYGNPNVTKLPKSKSCKSKGPKVKVTSIS